MKRVTRFTLAALVAVAMIVPPRGARAQGADARVATAQGADDTLPDAPTVTDRMLEPLPPPRRTVATWEDVLTFVRARSTDLRIAFDEVEKAEGQSRIALAGALTQLNATAASRTTSSRAATPPDPA